MTAPETPPSIKPGTILPTIGRRVWFHPRLEACTGAAGEVGMFQLNDATQPLDAGIVYVWNAGLVNLDVTDHAGRHHAVTSVHLLQGDEDPNGGESYATWMPYQAQQATKLEAAKEDFSTSSQRIASAFAMVNSPAGISRMIPEGPSQRDILEQDLVRGAAHLVATTPDNATNIAKGIVAMLDHLHPLPTLVSAADIVASVKSADAFPPTVPVDWGKAAPTLIIDGKAYHDGTTATGVAPLPDDSPAEEAPQPIACTAVRWKPGQAPRVLGTQVEDEIVDETYTVLPSGRVTICELTLQNGFTVWGSSAVVFSENNVPETGRKIAREKAVDQVWQLLGYALREKHA